MNPDEMFDPVERPVPHQVRISGHDLRGLREQLADVIRHIDDLLYPTAPKVAVSGGVPSFKLCDGCDRKMSCDKLQYCIGTLRRYAEPVGKPLPPSFKLCDECDQIQYCGMRRYCIRHLRPPG
jgi:hypothetical protein